MRIFSSSDYKPWKYDEVKSFLDDASDVGLKIKAVTKVVEFVEDFVDHPAINLIHLSIDTVGDGIPHKTAVYLKKKYPEKIKIRTIITKLEDLLYGIMKHVDVFTFYHGANKVNLGYSNFKDYDLKNFEKGVIDYNRWVKRKNTPESIREKVIERMKELEIAGKICCVNKKCSRCELACGDKGCEIS